MQGIHVSLLTGIAVIVIAYWLIGHAKAAQTLAGGFTYAYGNVAKTFQQSPSTG